MKLVFSPILLGHAKWGRMTERLYRFIPPPLSSSSCSIKCSISCNIYIVHNDKIFLMT